MTGDALGAAIAAEEHRQGMRHGDDPGHCGQCAEVALRRRQAMCEHDDTEWAEVTKLGEHGCTWLGTCRDCGLALRETTEIITWQ